jgi:glycerophosphoryl diester phosphodiesterase
VDVIGHRGCRNDNHAENTLAAVAAALLAGADGVEVDVRITRDNTVVCCHDPDLGRLTGIPRVISDTDDADLDRVILSDGHRLPRLAEILALVGAGPRLVLDVKPDPRRPGATATAVAALLRDCNWGTTDRLTVSSFDPTSLDVMHRDLPTIRRALIGRPGLSASACLAETIARGHQDAHPHVRALLGERSLPDRAHDKHVGIAGWTVNQPREIAALQAAGVDSIITDYPKTARAIVGVEVDAAARATP